MAATRQLSVVMKKRVVYMDDETWEHLRAVAKGQNVTMSEVLRRACIRLVAPPDQKRVRVPADDHVF